MIVLAHVLSGMVCLHLGQISRMDLVSTGIDLRFPISCCGRYTGYLYLPRWQSIGIVIFSHCFLGLDAGWCRYYHLGLVDKRSLWLRHTDGLDLRSLGPLPSPLHRWRFGRISGKVYGSLYPSLRSTPATPVGMVATG